MVTSLSRSLLSLVFVGCLAAAGAAQGVESLTVFDSTNTSTSSSATGFVSLAVNHGAHVTLRGAPGSFVVVVGSEKAAPPGSPVIGDHPLGVDPGTAAVLVDGWSERSVELDQDGRLVIADRIPPEAAGASLFMQALLVHPVTFAVSATNTVRVEFQKKATLLQGATSEYPLGGTPNGGVEIVADAGAWKDFWAKHTGNKDESPPAVDFGGSVVIAGFIGERPSSGFAADLTLVTATDLGFEILLTEVKHDDSCVSVPVVSAPHHVVVVPRPDGPLIVHTLARQGVSQGCD